jgi:osmotically inducible protein OsmC
MAAQSTATTVWEGDLGHGRGTTSPEELLASAHAACYCMALSHELGEAGNAPERLEATATVTFVPGEGVKSSEIVVRGRVPGIDQAAFEQAARAAGEGCPISGALKGNIDISVDATLES